MKIYQTPLVTNFSRIGSQEDIAQQLLDEIDLRREMSRNDDVSVNELNLREALDRIHGPGSTRGDWRRV